MVITLNKIDKDFYQLIKTLKNMDTEEIYENIKYRFSRLDQELQKNLENYFNRFNYWGSLNISDNNYEELYEKAKTLHNDLDDYIWLYEKLNDYKSKKLLFGILNNWYQYDFTTLKETKEQTFKHYFDLDLVESNENTVFVDIGAYIGDTTLDFIDTFLKNYKKIYCYEITDLSYSLLKNNLSKYKNIEFKKNAVGDSNTYVSINEHIDMSANKVDKEGNKKIKQITLDSDIKEKIDIIKMDIEGMEQQALKGSENHIKNDTPTLLISIYHKNEDYTKIAKYINKINKNYDFYLRSYSGPIYPTEIILICVKKVN